MAHTGLTTIDKAHEKLTAIPAIHTARRSDIAMAGLGGGLADWRRSTPARIVALAKLAAETPRAAAERTTIVEAVHDALLHPGETDPLVDPHVLADAARTIKHAATSGLTTRAHSMAAQSLDMILSEPPKSVALDARTRLTAAGTAIRASFVGSNGMVSDYVLTRFAQEARAFFKQDPLAAAGALRELARSGKDMHSSAGNVLAQAATAARKLNSRRPAGGMLRRLGAIKSLVSGPSMMQAMTGANNKVVGLERADAARRPRLQTGHNMPRQISPAR